MSFFPKETKGKTPKKLGLIPDFPPKNLGFLLNPLGIPEKSIPSSKIPKEKRDPLEKRLWGRNLGIPSPGIGWECGNFMSQRVEVRSWGSQEIPRCRSRPEFQRDLRGFPKFPGAGALWVEQGGREGLGIHPEFLDPS